MTMILLNFLIIISKDNLYNFTNIIFLKLFNHYAKIWASNCMKETRLKGLILLQKRSIRVIARVSVDDHIHNRFIELGIMKFENLNTYLTGLFTYKSIFKLLSISL